MIEFTFGHKLGEPQDGLYKCPACGRQTLTVAMGNPQDIGLFCSGGCTRGAILGALGFPEDIQICLSSPVLPPPQPVRTIVDNRGQKERLTWEQLVGELALRGWLVRFNVLSQEIEIDAKSDTSNRLLNLDDIVTVLHSDLAGKYKGCSLEALYAYVAYIAREESYNPVLEFLATLTWDGNDHLQDLYDLMRIEEDDHLSKALIRKWLYQCVALLYNDEEDPYGAEGVLVLRGAQGLGKTSLFRHLSMKSRWFQESGSIKDYDKDTPRRCVTVWLAELGELETTMKSDIAALRGFVTSSVDVYRPPYARSDRRVVRRSSLCATCNSDKYLVDPTGNRRWWTIPSSSFIDHAEIEAFDAGQLWAQIYAVVSELDQKKRAACFRLTRSERDQLAIRNGEHEKLLKAEAECRDILLEAEENGYTWEFMTVSQWKEENINLLRPYSSEQIGAALRHIGLEQGRDRIEGNKNASRGYVLPRRFSNNTQLRTVK